MTENIQQLEYLDVGTTLQLLTRFVNVVSTSDTVGRGVCAGTTLLNNHPSIIDIRTRGQMGLFNFRTS